MTTESSTLDMPESSPIIKSHERGCIQFLSYPYKAEVCHKNCMDFTLMNRLLTDKEYMNLSAMSSSLASCISYDSQVEEDQRIQRIISIQREIDMNDLSQESVNDENEKPMITVSPNLVTLIEKVRHELGGDFRLLDEVSAVSMVSYMYYMLRMYSSPLQKKNRISNQSNHYEEYAIILDQIMRVHVMLDDMVIIKSNSYDCDGKNKPKLIDKMYDSIISNDEESSRREMKPLTPQKTRNTRSKTKNVTRTKTNTKKSNLSKVGLKRVSNRKGGKRDRLSVTTSESCDWCCTSNVMRQVVPTSNTNG